MTEAEIKKALRDGADILERGDHLKGMFYDPNYPGSYCMLGAAAASCVGECMPIPTGMIPLLSEALGFTSPLWAISWSDAPERTKEEVIARLRQYGSEA